MDDTKVDQLVKEMTELCKEYATKTVMAANSPFGKILIGVVLGALLFDKDNRLWWKPLDS